MENEIERQSMKKIFRQKTKKRLEKGIDKGEKIW